MARIREANIFYRYKINSEAKGSPLTLNIDDKTAKKYQKRLSGRSLSSIDSEVWEYIILLLNDSENFTPDERNQEIIHLNSWYERATGGRQLRPEMLTACADFLLADYFNDRSSDKVTNEEFPVLGYDQLLLRRKREMSLEDPKLEFFDSKKYEIAHKKYTQENKENK
ncbi:hypothetical protein LN736_06255 [Clostridium sp. WLY-B-L2]|uniref:Uncharacterized protein n=1 Tax=Clostridium aromativorans TaxID=2836848 RepID=A0ABS8N3U4_9CLOT|nr:hypothetical protein [Clostridium aromativorans]MCC9294459.1 hypothetical protein [Clostridium aromativorans]